MCACEGDCHTLLNPYPPSLRPPPPHHHHGSYVPGMTVTRRRNRTQGHSENIPRNMDVADAFILVSVLREVPVPGAWPDSSHTHHTHREGERLSADTSTDLEECMACQNNSCDFTDTHTSVCWRSTKATEDRETGRRRNGKMPLKCTPALAMPAQIWADSTRPTRRHRTQQSPEPKQDAQSAQQRLRPKQHPSPIGLRS